MESRSKLEGKDVRQFVFAGNARFTLVSLKSGTRFTFRVRASKDKAVHFVSVLTGSDNESDYSYIGFIKGGDFIHGGRKAHPGKDAPSVKAFVWFFSKIDNLPTWSLSVFHEGCCGRCGRALTVPESIQNGLGPDCAQMMGLTGVKKVRAATTFEAPLMAPVTVASDIAQIELEMQRMEAQGDREQTEREETAREAYKAALEDSDDPRSLRVLRAALQAGITIN